MYKYSAFAKAKSGKANILISQYPCFR